MLLQACLDGARRPAEHPALPVTPAALAADAAATVGAGAGCLHVHVKDDDGADTLAPAPLATALAAVRAAVPGVPVGVTTGAWAEPDPAARVAVVAAWRHLAERPDLASVNWHEDGAEDVARALLESGIAVEAGLWTPSAAARWARSPVRDDCHRVLLELAGDVTAPDVPDAADALLAPVAGTGVPVLLHGEEASAWPALTLAGRRGLDTRIGLEDTLLLPDGAPAPDNVALVRAARRVHAATGRRGGA